MLVSFARLLGIGMGIAEYDAEIRRTASMFGVRPDIHPDDLMFQFYLKHDRDFHTGGIGVQRYFESGRDSARMVDELVHRFGPPASSLSIGAQS